MASKHSVSILRDQISERDFEVLLRRASDILKSARSAGPKKVSLIHKRSSSAA